MILRSHGGGAPGDGRTPAEPEVGPEESGQTIDLPGREERQLAGWRLVGHHRDEPPPAGAEKGAVDGPSVHLDSRDALRPPPLHEDQVHRRKVAGQRSSPARPWRTEDRQLGRPLHGHRECAGAQEQVAVLAGDVEAVRVPGVLDGRHADAARREDPDQPDQQRGLARSARTGEGHHRHRPSRLLHSPRNHVSTRSPSGASPVPSGIRTSAWASAGPRTWAASRPIGRTLPSGSSPAQRKRARPGRPSHPSASGNEATGRKILAAPASRRMAGRAKTSNATRQAEGLPGRPNTGFRADSAKRKGLPGFIGTPCTRTSAPRAASAPATRSFSPTETPPMVTTASAREVASARAARTSGASSATAERRTSTPASARSPSSAAPFESGVRPRRT